MRTREVKVVDKVFKILTLRHRDCTTRTTAWSTGLIATAIDEFLVEHPQDDTTPQKLYIKSLGKINSKSNPTYTYYNFKLKFV